MDLPAGAISHYWPLEHVQIGTVLQRSATRTVVGIRAVQGSFVAKVMDDEAALGLVSPTVEEIRRGLHVFEYLAQNDFRHIPALLQTRSGESFVRLDGKTIYIMEQVEGSHPRPCVEMYAELGSIAAKLNGYVDYPYAYPIPVHGTMVELAQEAERYSFKDEFLKQVAQLDVLADQPAALIHGEINPSNALRTSDGRLYLLDWDAAGTGPAILEAGYPLLTTFLAEDLTFHHDWAAAFYDGYTSGAGMTMEQKNLLFVAALLHALRYLKFHHPLQRWARICYALDHRDLLLAAIPTKGVCFAASRAG